MTTDELPDGSPIVVCKNREEVTRALAGFRHYRGLSQLAFDERIGWTDGYTSKVEQPFSGGPWKSRQGRCAMHGSFDEWIQGLGVVVIIVPKESLISNLGEDDHSRAIQILVPRHQLYPKMKRRRRVKAKRKKRPEVAEAA